MNAEAAALGMHHTTYTDPSGYLDTTVSTASDQVLLAQAALRLPVFAQIVAEPSVTLPVVGMVPNVDLLAGTDGFVGVKTGSDSEANGCFTFANVEPVAGKPVTIVGAVLDQGQGSSDIVTAALDAASRLVASVRADVTRTTLVPAETPVLDAVGADRRIVPVKTTTGLQQIGWGGLRIPLTVAVAPLGRTLRAGQAVAQVSAGAADGAVTAAATDAVPPPGLGWRVRHIF